MKKRTKENNWSFNFVEKFENTLSRLGPKKTNVLQIAIILLVSIAVYANAVNNGFVYDDRIQILENPWIKDFRFLPDIFTSGVWGFQPGKITNYYRPMMHVVYMLTYYIFGLRPWAFHFMNVMLHAGVSILVFIISRTIFMVYSPLLPPEARAGSGRACMAGPAAFISALLFAAHPIHTETVAWVAGLPDLACAFLCLLSFYFYLRYDEGPRWIYLSCASYAIALLFKEPALMLPLFLSAYDFAFRRHGLSISYFFKIQIPYLVIILVYLGLRSYALAGLMPMEPFIKLSPSGYIINTFQLFAGHLQKLFLPLNLNAFHVFRPVSSLSELKGIVSLSVAAAFIAATLIGLKKDRVLFFCLSTIALPLLPALFIPAVGENALAERYLYLPSFGFAVLASSFFLMNRPGRGITTALIVLALLTADFSALTVRRNAVWRSDFSLWSDTVRKSPEASIPHYNLGVIYVSEKDFVGAAGEFTKALQIDPFNDKARNNLGSAYVQMGLLEDAVRQYEIASINNPGNPEPQYNLGLVYRKLNLPELAEKHYSMALIMSSGHTEAINGLAQVYLGQGRREEAIELLERAHGLDPSNKKYEANLEKARSRAK